MALFDESVCNLKDLFLDALSGKNEDASGIQQSVYLCAGIALASFLVNIASGNYSQVDKAWSIVPFVYVWLVVNDERTLLMAILSTIWGVRLTWNFNRRGGYSWPPWTGDEDYRWKYLQDGFLFSQLKNPIIWSIFNFGFICCYQHFLLWLIASPAVAVHLISSSCGKVALNALDYGTTILFLIAVMVEAIADNEQFRFQTEKYRLKRMGAVLTGEYADGFKQSGLFSFVRKPNYAAEQLVWICFYFFSVAATDCTRIWNWSALGFILLCILFQGSGWFTEGITMSKYPKYYEYRKSTPLYLPNMFQIFRKSKIA